MTEGMKFQSESAVMTVKILFPGGTGTEVAWQAVKFYNLL